MGDGRTILSLALIYNTWSEFKYDYIDCFLPFVATVIRNGKSANLREIKSLIKKEFGLDIPTHPLSVIIKRAQKKKIIFNQISLFKVNPGKLWVDD